MLGDSNIHELSEQRFVGALVYLVADPASATLTVREREADPRVTPPGLAQGGAVHFVEVGPNVEEATEDAARRAVDFTLARTDLSREEAYMLLSIIGELRHRAATG